MVVRSRVFVVLAAVAIVGLAAAILILRDDMRCAGFAGPGVTSEELPAPAAPGTLRIATWNIRNFPLDERPQQDDLGFSRRTNICDLEDVLSALDADLLGLAEIGDKRRFPPILRRATGDARYGIRFSSHGGRWGQMIALAWNMDRLELVGEPFEVPGVALDPSLRPALGAWFRSVDEPGLSFAAVQVHLAATPRGFDERQRQYDRLVEWARAAADERGEVRLVVMGDFNTTGWPDGSTNQELELLDSVFATAGFGRLPNATGCTEYWEGRGDRDGVQVPALLDLVYVRGLESWSPSRAQSWLHCRRLSCGQMISIKGREDGTFWDVSDHCPVTFDLDL